MSQHQAIAHFSEMRKRIILVLGTYVIFLAIGFLSVKRIYNWLLADVDISLTVLGPSEILWIYFVLASLFAFTFTIPVMVYHIWSFVKPGLKTEERRITLWFIPLLLLLFIGGLSFGYYVVFPSVFAFITSLSSGMFDTLFTVEKYFRFLFQVTVPLGLLFELPAVVLFLTYINILTPTMMTKYRKYVYFALVVLSAIITPPDFISQLFVFIPMIILYEASYYLCMWVYNQQQKKRSAELLSVD